MDERKNLPSASGMERLKRCRGSWNLEKDLTDIAVSDIAERGTLIHAALDGSVNPDDLGDQEFYLYERCQEIEEAIVREVFGFDIEITDLIVTGEERIFLVENGIELMSGKFDKLYRDPGTGKALIIDYKTGYKAVTDPDSNMQLRAYAVLVGQQYHPASVTVAAIQPICKPSWSKCEYLPEHIDIARKEILRIIDTAEVQDAARVPGDKQCEYCKAKSVCKELADFATSSLTDIQKVHEIILTAPQEIDLREKLVSGEELSKLLDRTDLITKWSEALDEEAKLRLRTNRIVPNYGMFPGVAKRKIVNNIDFYEEFKKYGKQIIDDPISPKDIIDTASFSIGKIEKLVNRNKRFKVKDMKQVLKDLFSRDLIGETTPENVLKRIKEED